MSQPKWWMDLTPEQRVIHYKRNTPCECPLNEQDWPPEFFEAFSYDPYFHINHSGVHSIDKFFKGTCDCNQCKNHSGIPPGLEHVRFNEEKVREKLRLSFANEKAQGGDDDVF